VRGLLLILVVTSSARADPRIGNAFRAYEKHDLAEAKKQLAGLRVERVANRDYLYWIRGMVALRSGEYERARDAFERLAGIKESRFQREAAWRLADATWDHGDRAAAAAAYAKLIGKPGDDSGNYGDVGTAMFRIAETKAGKPALTAYRALVLSYPAHPLAARAEQILAERAAPALTSGERIDRAKRLTDAHLWDEAVAEISLIDRATLPDALQHQRDYWLGTTLFKMRRRYDESAGHSGLRS
jgi:hypothetical protein